MAKEMKLQLSFHTPIESDIDINKNHLIYQALRHIHKDVHNKSGQFSLIHDIDPFKTTQREVRVLVKWSLTEE
jgi:hypothetical protein